MSDTTTTTDSYIGVRPGCGCISAWLSKTHATTRDVRDFYREMADSGREVREARLEDVRDRIDMCPHVMSRNRVLQPDHSQTGPEAP